MAGLPTGKEPDAAELARQADVIAGAGAELTKTALPEVKTDVDTMLKATAEAKAGPCRQHG